MTGNALHQLFAFSQPRVAHFVAVTFDDHDDGDVSEVPGVHPDAVLHLHRQASRINHGIQADDVTALLIPEIGSETSKPGRIG